MKPEVSKHEILFELERELRAPVRFVWVMLPGHADREGRFKWRPRALKSEILPYDEVDFGAILDGLIARGMLVRYRVAVDWFGWIPTFRKHQSVNTREADSDLPALSKAEEAIDLRNQQPSDTDAEAHSTEQVHASGERKGREGKGKEGKGTYASTTRPENASNGINASQCLEAILKLFPKRAGRMDWTGAAHHIGLLIERQEATGAQLVEQVQRYRQHCEAVGSIGTQHVLNPTTFFSAADKPWSQDWPIPAKKKTTGERLEALGDDA